MTEQQQVIERPSENEEEERWIWNGSNCGTKISDEENDYLNYIYYSPVAFSGFQKIYKF